MIYATAQQFILRVGEQQTIELTDRTFTKTVDKAVLAVALSDSSSQMDGYLSGRYPLPLPFVPANLTRICCDLTRYRLCSMSDRLITDEVIQRYKLSLKELELIAEGKISLGIDDRGAEIAGGDNTVIFTNTANRIFARNNYCGNHDEGFDDYPN